MLLDRCSGVQGADDPSCGRILVRRLVYLTAITGGMLAVMSLAGWGTPPADAARGASEQQTMWLVLYVLLIIAAPVNMGLRPWRRQPRHAPSGRQGMEP